MIGEKYLYQNYWKHLSEVIILMYHTAKLFSDLGYNVLIDGILVEQPEIKPHYQKLKEILSNNPLDIIEVSCPLELCRQRNINRCDRYEMQSQEQYNIMAKEICYSCKVETDKNSSDECADYIMTCLFNNLDKSV